MKNWWLPISILTLAVVVFIVVIDDANTRSEQERTAILMSLSILQIALAAPACLLLQRLYLPRAEKSLDKLFALGWAEVGVGLIVLIIALFLVCYTTVRDESGLGSLSQIIWLILYQILFIGLAEELLFRGIPFSVLPRYSWLALVVSSALFALYHWNMGLMTLPYYFALGLILAVLRSYGFPLLILAAGHGIFNAALEIVWPIGGYRFGLGSFYVVMPLTLFCLAMLAGWGLSALENQRRKEVYR